MNDDIDLAKYSGRLAPYMLLAECELIENDKGLWIWKGNELIGRLVCQPPRTLTPSIMRDELADLQRRIDVAFAVHDIALA